MVLVPAFGAAAGLPKYCSGLRSNFSLALGTAEVIRLPFVLGSSSGSTRFYVHAAHSVFHSYCAVHYDLLRCS